MDKDLFEDTLKSDIDSRGQGVSYEHWMWAERVIQEVNRDIAKEDNLSKHFVQGWIRWKEIVGMLNLMDLSFHQTEVPKKENIRSHETFVTMLISLGNMLESISTHIENDALEYSGFCKKSHYSMMESLRDSWETRHGKKNEGRSNLINALFTD